MRRPGLPLVASTLVLATTALMTGCSITITSNEPTEAASGMAEASAAPSDFRSEFYDFCALEARGSMDFISILGPDAADAIAEGIAQSIELQALTGDDAQACTDGWVDTLALAGITYDPATGTMTGEFTALPSLEASPAAS